VIAVAATTREIAWIAFGLAGFVFALFMVHLLTFHGKDIEP